MSRWLKALRASFGLSLAQTLALAALCIVAVGCSNSTQPAQIRFVHAIQNVGAMDIDITSPNQINPTQVFTDIPFLGVQPNQPGHTSIPSGLSTMEGFLAGTTNVAFDSTKIELFPSQAYTLVSTGLVANGQGAVIMFVSDNIPTPPAGDVAFRVIHASPSGPATVDVYIQLNPPAGPNGNPTIAGLGYEGASFYLSFINNPNNDTNAPGFTVFVTAAGTTAPPYLISEPIYPEDGAVRSLLLTDVQNGNSMASSFLELTDLN